MTEESETERPEVNGATFLEGLAWVEKGVPGPLHVLTTWQGGYAWTLELRPAGPPDPGGDELRLELAVTRPQGTIVHLAVGYYLVEHHLQATVPYHQVVIVGGPTLRVRHLT